MYRAGHLLRRSSVRLKSFSKGHTNLQMIISQIREVKSAFKAFITAQSTLSEDLVRWSSTLENEALHQTFINLAELNNLWTEAQKDFADSLKQFRCHFDLILEGEKHVDQAKQNYATREESEKSIRKELQKAYNKASSEEIQLLRERLNRSEKSKELAHLDVVDRVRENEAVRMIRLKEGIMNVGSSYVQMSHKASIIYGAQQKVGNEIPDVHDKAIQGAKYRGSVSARHVDEAKMQLRCYSTAALPRRHSYADPPPPYSPSRERLDDLSKDMGSLQSPSAPTPTHSSPPFSSASSIASPSLYYPSFPSSPEDDSALGNSVLTTSRGWDVSPDSKVGASGGAAVARSNTNSSSSRSPSPDYELRRTSGNGSTSSGGDIFRGRATPPRRRSQRGRKGTPPSEA